MCRLCYLIDAANPETESPAFNACSIHIIPDKQNKLLESRGRSGMRDGWKGGQTFNNSLKLLAPMRLFPASDNLRAL